MPFEQAPMGVTGLETAFAALHTDLVVPGVLPLALLVERHDRRAARCSACPRPRSPPASRPTSRWSTSTRELGGRRGRLREPLGELLLRTGATLHRARPA